MVLHQPLVRVRVAHVAPSTAQLDESGLCLRTSSQSPYHYSRADKFYLFDARTFWYQGLIIRFPALYAVLIDPRS